MEDIENKIEEKIEILKFVCDSLFKVCDASKIKSNEFIVESIPIYRNC